jgi:hypothetical protein
LKNPSHSDFTTAPFGGHKISWRKSAAYSAQNQNCHGGVATVALPANMIVIRC